VAAKCVRTNSRILHQVMNFARHKQICMCLTHPPVRAKIPAVFRKHYKTAGIASHKINMNQNNFPPITESDLSGVINMTLPSLSGTPSVKTSDSKGPIFRGGKFTTPNTNFPASSSFV